MRDHMAETSGTQAATVQHPVRRNAPPLIEVGNLDLWYDHGEVHALRDISLDLYHNEVLAFIGPSGCGKSTMLKVFNRMHDMNPGVRTRGRVTLDGIEIHHPDIDPPLLRRRFGWVAQKPNPFPMSIWDNVAYGPRIHGLARTRAELADVVEDCLRRAHLWDEVKDHLHDMEGTDLSGGQQQRLCIARAIAVEPDVILMDEPTSALDPISTSKIEDLIEELKQRFTIIIVTHNMQQAGRVSDNTAFFLNGEIIEAGTTRDIFFNPKDPQTEAYISGRFG